MKPITVSIPKVITKYMAATITAFGVGALVSSNAFAESAMDTYKKYCASCHGANLTGGMGPSLVDDVWKHGSDDASIAKAISHGVPKAGMPAWKAMFDEATIRSLVILIREHASKASKSSHTTNNEVAKFTSAAHTFTVSKYVELPGTIWAIGQLTPSSFIATLKEGRLFVIHKGKPTEIVGLPDVWSRSQAGLLDVLVDPNYEKNGWIYLSYSDKGTSLLGSGMTKIVRGKIEKGKWTAQQDLFTAKSEHYTSSGVHFGSRFAIQGDYLFFSIGDRGAMNEAQDLSKPNGKIHRIHLDGRTPKDNPFINTKGAYPTVYSYGHRNPQGLDFHPGTGALWETEHGPRGGDEVNIIQPALNYGWPEITYGMNYNGTPMDAGTHKEGMEQPLHYWVPSIATGGIDFYDGDAFPAWKNHILASGMAARALHLVELDESHTSVKKDHILFSGLGRVRDVLSGDDGYIYVAINPGGGKQGAIHRVEPAK